MLQQVMTNPGEITFREVPVPEPRSIMMVILPPLPLRTSPTC